ncbi:MAG: cyclic nucleotide-binding domain-containing protein, partial [Thermodesulfobacteriota bacterium]
MALAPSLAALAQTPEVASLAISYADGEVIFREGDESQDLYLLVSGAVEITKAGHPLSRLDEAGLPFGEISFLLGTPRTATALARGPVAALRLPRHDIPRLLERVPELALEIPRSLAARLAVTSRVLTGLKELCDQLPDAVTVSDQAGRILAWNQAAELLYGHSAEEMARLSMDDLYEEPAAYRSLAEAVASQGSVRERLLAVRGKDGGRWVSTSGNALRGSGQELEGILALGRDASEQVRTANRYRRLRYRVLPLVAALALVSALLVMTVPRFLADSRVVDLRHQGFAELVTRDQLLITAGLSWPLPAQGREAVQARLQELLAIQAQTGAPYSGILLLDPELRVVAAASRGSAEGDQGVLGTSYSGVTFHQATGSSHRVLTPYRVDRRHPTGSRGLEIA